MYQRISSKYCVFDTFLYGYVSIFKVCPFIFHEAQMIDFYIFARRIPSLHQNNIKMSLKHCLGNKKNVN